MQSEVWSARACLPTVQNWARKHLPYRLFVQVLVSLIRCLTSAAWALNSVLQPGAMSRVLDEIAVEQHHSLWSYDVVCPQAKTL